MPHFSPGSFVHVYADNVDHNSRTIDGYDTFLGMGIITCNTPGIPFNREINETHFPRIVLRAECGATPYL